MSLSSFIITTLCLYLSRICSASKGLPANHSSIICGNNRVHHDGSSIISTSLGNNMCIPSTTDLITNKTIQDPFIYANLEAGQVVPIVWANDGKLLSEYAFQVGLPKELSAELLNYCRNVGMLDLLRELFYVDPMEVDENEVDDIVDLQDGRSWYLQRPSRKWNADMYWISPANEFTHENYVQILGRGNFDAVLEGIGHHLGLEGLAIYQVSFSAFSSSRQEGFVHYDISGSNGRALNVIIPLILEDENDAISGLLLSDDEDADRTGNWSHRRDYGIVIGDDVMYSNQNCDYRHHNGMHLTANVYIADINKENVEAIASETLAQLFPMPDTKWLMAQAGRHWGNDNSISDDRGRKVYRFDDDLEDCNDRAMEGMCKTDTLETRPKCAKACRVYIEEGPSHTQVINETHFDVCVRNRTGSNECRIFGDTDSPGSFVTPNLAPGEMFPVIWREDGKRAADYAFQIKLPNKLTLELLTYSEQVGITDLFRSLLGPDPIEPQEEHSGKIVSLNDGNKWYAQRPAKKWLSNMHWVSPADEITHEDYLKVLARGDFDQVLESIGKYLGLEGLVAYHLTFIGVSHSVKGFVHHDFEGTGASVYNVIIPLILEEEADPELIITDSQDETKVGNFKYQLGYGAMMGDGALHGTEACDYRHSGGMRLAATIYIADINKKNAAAIASQTLTQIFPLPDTNWLMAQSGRHWGGSNKLVGDHGREPFDFDDEIDDCDERKERGLCDSDTDYTRSSCLKTCGVYMLM